MSSFKRAINKVPAMVLRSPLHILMSKSRGKYTTPVTYVREGDVFLMTTDSPWWKNLRSEGGAPVISLRVEDQEYAAHGEAVTDEAEVARSLEIFTRKFPRYGRYAGMEMDPAGRVTLAAIEKAVRERVAVRTTIEGTGRSPR